MSTGLQQRNRRPRKTPFAWDLAIATLILASAVGAGGTALWAGRHNATKKAPPPTFTLTTFPLTNTLVGVPDVSGQDAFSAVATLASTRLNFTISKGHSEAVPAGSVVSMSPAHGTKIRTGTVVHLVVSAGP